MATSASALADPRAQECIAANESAIVLRKDSKLREARDQVLSCTSAGCPADIRTECESLLLKLNAAMPTVVFDAKDTSGGDLVSATVRIDDAGAAQALDGTAISLDPGAHRFAFEAAGHPAVLKTIVLHEGEKDRHERIVFETPGPASHTAPTLVRDPTRRVIGLVTAGVGLLGIGLGTFFGVRASSLWSSSQSECKSPTDCTNHDQAVSDHDDAATAATLSTIALAAGGALFALGGVLFFTAPYVTPGRTGSVGFNLVARF